MVLVRWLKSLYRYCSQLSSCLQLYFFSLKKIFLLIFFKYLKTGVNVSIVVFRLLTIRLSVILLRLLMIFLYFCHILWYSKNWSVGAWSPPLCRKPLFIYPHSIRLWGIFRGQSDDSSAYFSLSRSYLLAFHLQLALCPKGHFLI